MRTPCKSWFIVQFTLDILNPSMTHSMTSSSFIIPFQPCLTLFSRISGDPSCGRRLFFRKDLAWTSRALVFSKHPNWRLALRVSFGLCFYVIFHRLISGVANSVVLWCWTKSFFLQTVMRPCTSGGTWKFFQKIWMCLGRNCKWTCENYESVRDCARHSQ